eukprot:SAG31_NODE_354_length_17223_cov_18.708771_3_plen_88_part_00
MLTNVTLDNTKRAPLATFSEISNLERAVFAMVVPETRKLKFNILLQPFLYISMSGGARATGEFLLLSGSRMYEAVASAEASGSEQRQ